VAVQRQSLDDCTPAERRKPAPSANLLLDELFGAIYRILIKIGNVFARDLISVSMEETISRPYGGSSPTGIGICVCREEFMKQNFHADWMVLAHLGGRMRDWCWVSACLISRQGVGIALMSREEWLKMHVSKIARCEEKLERIEFTPADVSANANYCGAGYGVLTDAEREAVNLFAKYEGLLLDPVYTGRAAAGMIDLIRKGFFKKDETVLFWQPVTARVVCGSIRKQDKKRPEGFNPGRFFNRRNTDQFTDAIRECGAAMPTNT
jgi:1-aminocyclopropane-1-carboxylate deaminase/D-cysteine desulfhydrase-like pyridoxal-dependent ACC family enzyme